jgi:hypothetical protein
MPSVNWYSGVKPLEEEGNVQGRGSLSQAMASQEVARVIGDEAGVVIVGVVTR